MRRNLFLSGIAVFVLLSLGFVVLVDADFYSVWNKTYGGIYDDEAYSLVATSDGGYAIAGTTESFGAGGSDFWLVKTDAYGNVQWNKTYGGPTQDYAQALVETSDGGYAIAGYNQTVIDLFEMEQDALLVKTDEFGNMEWNRTYGGTDIDSANSVIQTSDGGYAIAGSIFVRQKLGYDFWLVKTDEQGNMEWHKTYGNFEADYAYSVVQTSDGGYAIAGITWVSSVDMDVDCQLVKTDPQGNMEWNRTYGGTGIDEANSVIQTSDGGYAIAGATFSYGAGKEDFWLVKTDASGDMEWSQVYGGAKYDIAHSVVETSDGGYTLAGYTECFGAGSNDFWLVKTDVFGNTEWRQTYGGTGSDRAYSMVETSDGGYALAGYTESFGALGSDFWLIKTDEFGVVSADSLVWYNLYGDGWSTGTGSNVRECGYSLIATSDGGYAIAGQTDEFGAGGRDFWLLKFDAYGIVEWNKTYGGPRADVAESLVETSDGGYAIVGTLLFYVNDSSGVLWEDFWLVKTDAYGDMEWNKTYGGTGREYGKSLVATSDGGYTIGGYRLHDGFWLIKTDAYGNMEWNKIYGRGGSYWESDEAHSLIATSDGGYAMAGGTCLVKTDEIGNMQWNKTYGGRIRSLVETSDGGYAMAGYTEIGGGQTTVWLVKTDVYGNMEWSKTCGGRRAYSLIQTSDGGYAMAGYARSDHWYDMYLVKVDEFGDAEWSRTWSGVEDEVARSLIQTSDGGYALTGKMHNYLVFIKTDEYGVVPEYSSWLLPSLLMTATLVVVVYKRKRLEPSS